MKLLTDNALDGDILNLEILFFILNLNKIFIIAEKIKKTSSTYYI
jgi:hypothetical protein